MASRLPAFLIGSAAAIGLGTFAYHAWGPSGGDASALQPAPPADPAAGQAASPASAADAPVAPVAAAASAADRYRLVGVLSSGNESLAMIAIGGQPARSFRVGDVVDGDIVLRGVSAGGATLGPRDGGTTLALEAARPAEALPAAAPTAQTLPATAPRPPMSVETAEGQSRMRATGGRHAPLAPKDPVVDAPKPAAAQEPPDDGRWRPPPRQ